MFFTSSEQRHRSKAFDTCREVLDATLHDPAIISVLGSLATDIKQINDNSFLPNALHGTFVAPIRQLRSHNTALIPVTKDEDATLTDLTAPLMSAFPLHWRNWHVGLHNPYGYIIDPAGSEELACDFPPDTSMPVATDTSMSRASSTSAHLRSSKDGKQYYSTRPVSAVRMELLQEPAWSLAAALGQEAVHAHDITNHGPLFSNPFYKTGSLARGLHVAKVMFDRSHEQPPRAAQAYQAESLRMAQISLPSMPFRVTPWLTERFIDENILQL